MASDTSTNTYQIAGVDELDRGFNRQAEIRNHDGQYQAIFRYEKFLLQAEPQKTEHDALAILISQLHERGYTQLRSRLHFRGEHYLGSQEIWEEHPDPQPGNVFRQFLDHLQRIWNTVKR